MKHVLIAPIALLAAAGCTQADRATANAAGSDNIAVAAESRPEGSIGGASQPAGHMAGSDHRSGDHMALMTGAPGDSPATLGYKASMMKMMQDMPPYTGDPDVDFNKQMRVHHIAAIDMAEAQLAHGRDPATTALARKIMADQKREVAQIDAWLRARGQ